MARKSQSDKGRDILKSKKIYPEFNVLDYDGSLRKNLEFYSVNIDASVKKASAVAHWKKQGKDTAKVSKLSEGWFITCGAVAHMIGRGIDLDPKHHSYLDKKYVELVEFAKDEVEDDVKVPQLTKEEKTDNEVSVHIAEFEAGLDQILKGKPFDAQGYLIRNEVKPAITKRIATWFKPLLKELKDVDSDSQLKEAYSHMTRRAFNKFKEQVESMVASCEVASAITKARKPRTKKVKAPSAVAKGVKCMKEFTELKMVSVAAEKLVNSDEVWIYNTKVRRLFKYVALQGLKMSVKGTTLTGFDPEKSGGKILRKPEVQLKDCSQMTSRPLTKLYNEVRAVASKPTGRINEDCIILKVF